LAEEISAALRRVHADVADAVGCPVNGNINGITVYYLSNGRQPALRGNLYRPSAVGWGCLSSQSHSLAVVCEKV
jgi:hypothetical protein